MAGQRRSTRGQPSATAPTAQRRGRPPRKVVAPETTIEAQCTLAAAIAGDLDLRSLVGRILVDALAVVGARRGILFLGRADDVGLVPSAVVSIAGDEIRAIEQMCRGLLAQPGPVLASVKAADDRRLAQIPGVRAGAARAVYCAPLVLRGAAVGVLYLDAPCAPRRIPPEPVRQLEVLAGLAAVALENARVHGELVRENRRLRHRLGSQESVGRLHSFSPIMDSLRQRAALAAGADVPVLILGEPGTGRQMLARAVHEAGPRALGPFVVCGCAAGPRDLMAPLLLGSARSVHPGMPSGIVGLLRQADRGVLYLDEVAELETQLLARLLRALDERAVRPQHGLGDQRIDVQLISATSRDLRAEVRAGRFPEQLYYRISAVELRIPPLRERPEDIPLLIDHFLEQQLTGRGVRRRVRFARDAIEFLQGLIWRGNERELECVVHRALLYTRRATIDLAAVRRLVMAVDGAPTPDGAAGAWPARHAGQLRTLAEQEREALREALVRSGGNKAQAARLLGLHRNTFLRRIRRLDVTVD